MTKAEIFKAKIAETRDYEEIDCLCLLWLKEACKDYAGAGATARKLLDLVEELMV